MKDEAGMEGEIMPARSGWGALRRLVLAVLAVGLFLFLLWLAGLIWFAADIPDRVEDETTATDAIVVLTGGSDRVRTGLALLAEGKARKLLVSGVHRDVEMTELLSLFEEGRNIDSDCCVVLGYAADNTIGNASETAAWMVEEGYDSLRVVTANYHMRRSLMEFRRAMPGVRLIPHPVFPDQFKRDEWWRWPGTAHLLATEYTKYLAAFLRHKLIDHGNPPG
ncbi:YdcF family protein [Telmatospirillum sp. J64-1]|uniref:YdcF family protein n=1 Tax=Telmatospirillum sp. J64-1 TaxID=2502183 RepID=UPI002106C0A6|nr:YdcF family protein [Telmatospirillum sp. J64-1]